MIKSHVVRIRVQRPCTCGNHSNNDIPIWQNSKVFFLILEFCAVGDEISYTTCGLMATLHIHEIKHSGYTLVIQTSHSCVK